MNDLTNDTPPKIEAMQIALLRRMGATRRLLLTDQWTRDVLTLSWTAHQQRHPALSELELRLLWIDQLYGRDLAERVRARLEERAE